MYGIVVSKSKFGSIYWFYFKNILFPFVKAFIKLFLTRKDQIVDYKKLFRRIKSNSLGLLIKKNKLYEIDLYKYLNVMYFENREVPIILNDGI